MRVYTVSELTKEIKFSLEEAFPSVWVEGELSNLRAPESGHLYFSLKDEYSQIRCVMFKSHVFTLPVELVNGIKTRVWGSVGVYERDGSYQLYVQEVKPVGLGELAIRFERLKKKLRGEGLFDSKHKKPLPKFPESMGLVTSPTGAAVRDIIRVARRRFPSCTLILNPVRVQGAGAAEEIARAIDEFNEYGKVDLIIVGRGGGSMEDLWAFNEEILARAIFRSFIPVISAVGLGENVISKIEGCRERLRSVQLSYGFRRPPDLLIQKRQAIDELERALEVALSHSSEMWRSRTQSLNLRLESVNPHAVLARGYSISRKLPERRILKDTKDLEIGDEVEIQFLRGKAGAQIKTKDL